MKNTLKRSTPKYKLWRANVYARDGWKCRLCFSKKRIEAHHIYPVRTHFDKAYEPDNGITLCFKCHRLIFGKELLLAPVFEGILKNGVNSVKLPPSKVEDNTEPSIESDLDKGVTTRSRVYSLKQFIKKQVSCVICGKTKTLHYYRIKRAKNFLCGNPSCRGQYIKSVLSGKKCYKYKGPMKNKCLNCGKATTTPSDWRRIKKYCDNTCQNDYERKNGLKKKPKPYLNGRWTKKHDACIACGKKDHPHTGKGFCSACYFKHR